MDWMNEPQPFEGETPESGPAEEECEAETETPENGGSVEREDATGPAAEMRERLLRRFENWLDEALSDEDPPEGLAAEIIEALDAGRDTEGPEEREDSFDLYSLWGGMTALSQEVKLQGRTFKQLNDSLMPLGEMGSQIDEVLHAHDDALSEARALAETVSAERSEREEEVSARAERLARQELLETLLDLRDRLSRGLESARSHLDEVRVEGKGNWLAALRPGSGKHFRRLLESAEAMEKGYFLTLERLAEALEAFNVREIECVGELFDPRLMTAVDVVETAEVQEGLVVEVYRPGYTWNSEVFRPAQVKVARAPQC